MPPLYCPHFAAYMHQLPTIASTVPFDKKPEPGGIKTPLILLASAILSTLGLAIIWTTVSVKYESVVTLVALTTPQ